MVEVSKERHVDARANYQLKECRVAQPVGVQRKYIGATEEQ